MKARRDDGLWEITEGHKYWTFHEETGLILNADLRGVKIDGALGKRILAAVAVSKRVDQFLRDKASGDDHGD